VSAYLTTASNEFETNMILDRLAAAGVRAVHQGTLGPTGGSGGARDIYVEEPDLVRAREALEVPEGDGDEVLIELREEAGARPAQPSQEPSIEGQAPVRHLWQRIFKRGQRRRRDPFGRPTDDRGS
jgi:hypothetical protein